MLFDYVFLTGNNPFLWIVWGRNPPQSCLSALGMLATSDPLGGMLRNVYLALSSSDMGSLWDLSHIDKRSAPPMPYKLELKAWVYPYKNYYRRVCKNNIYSSIILFSLSLHLMTFLFLFLRINDFFVLLFLYIILLYSYIILMCWMLKTRMLDVL